MSQLRLAVAGIPGKWSTERLAEAVREQGVSCPVVDLAYLKADLASGRVWCGDVELTALDGLLVKKVSEVYAPATLDRLQLLSLVEQAGVRVFSPTAGMLKLVNRLSCTLSLQRAQIPMPATTITEDLTEAEKAVERYGVAVVKPLFSTKARGMLVLSARKQADWRKQLREFKDTHSLFYIQQRVDLQGRDYGLVFLAGEYQGAYARVGHEESWNTTVQSGGKYASFDAPAEMVELAQRAQAPFQLDFTTVDVAQTQQGPVVFEVSAFGGFRGAEQGFQWDAAAGYAEHALQVLR